MKSKTAICVFFLALIATPHFTVEAGLLDGLGGLVGGKFHFDSILTLLSILYTNEMNPQLFWFPPISATMN